MTVRKTAGPLPANFCADIPLPHAGPSAGAFAIPLLDAITIDHGRPARQCRRAARNILQPFLEAVEGGERP